MERDPDDVLLPPPAPGIFGQPADNPPPLRLHPIERELHSISSAVGRMANSLERIAPALETISKNIAALRELVDRERR